MCCCLSVLVEVSVLSDTFGCVEVQLFERQSSRDTFVGSLD